MQVLEGLKVLDLTKWLPGQYCTMMLGDFGAEIIKVEDIGGDTTRQFTPQKTSNMSFWHLALNRNKKGIAVDLRSAAGQKIIHELILEADIVVESFRPGVMRKMGVDYATVSQEKPSIIYCSLTGFGQTGKYSHTPAHDLNIVGLAGVSSEAESGAAMVSNVQVSGISGSLNAFSGILLALLAKAKNGLGQHVDIALYNSALNFEITSLSSFFGRQTLGSGDVLDRIGHYYNLYKTQDGRYLTVGTIEPKFWQELCSLLKVEDLRKRQFDFEHSDEVKKRLSEVFATKSLDEWLVLIGDKEFCVTPVLTLEEAMASEVTSESGLVTTRQEDLGEVAYLQSAVKLSSTPASITRRAPLLGEHTEDVLKKLGYTEDMIIKLREEHII